MSEPTARGVDYSFGRPGGANVAAEGFTFAIRYVPYEGDGGKGLRPPEVADLRANGIDIGLVFEVNAERHLRGYAQGVSDAQLAAQAARGIGFPQELPIYFAVDFDAQPHQYPAIDAYQQGAISILGLERVGIYGHERMCRHAAETWTASWFWQCLAWSYGRHFEGRHFYQSNNGKTINGAPVDWNLAYGSKQGLWKAEEGMASAEYDELKERLSRLERASFAGSEYSADHDTAAIALQQIAKVVDGDPDQGGKHNRSIADVAYSASPSNHDHDSRPALGGGMTQEQMQHIIAAGDELRRAGGVNP